MGGETETPLDGSSLVPAMLLANVGHRAVTAKMVAFSQYPRYVRDEKHPWAHNGINHKSRSLFTHMGYSIRTVDWRYTEWRRWDGLLLKANWDDNGLVASELYDHRNETIYPTDFDA